MKKRHYKFLYFDKRYNKFVKGFVAAESSRKVYTEIAKIYGNWLDWAKGVIQLDEHYPEGVKNNRLSSNNR